MGTERPLKLRQILKPADLLRELHRFEIYLTLTCGATSYNETRMNIDVHAGFLLSSPESVQNYLPVQDIAVPPI